MCLVSFRNIFKQFILKLIQCLYILFSFQGGQYVIALIDKYATSFPLLTVAFLETIVISWVYGASHISIYLISLI